MGDRKPLVDLISICARTSSQRTPHSYPSRVQLSVRIIPQTAGTNTKVRLDNAWGRFEAP